MQQKGRLRAGSLSFVEVLAASVALIGLSMTPVLIAPYMYGAAGNGSWLAYVFAGLMLLFVGMSLNRFARRTTGSGSMFLYAARELGPAIGALGGWSLIWAYVFVGASQFGAQTLFIGQLSGALGLSVPAMVTMMGLALLCIVLAVRDVALSTIVMLALETISVAIICTLVGFVLAKHGAHLDPAQLHLEGVGKASIGLGIATAIFSFVGFESATAFGDEARNPFVTIPRAVVWSVIIASMFFVLALYTEILGLHGAKPPLDQQTAPLWSLAEIAGIPYLKIPITIGAIFSSFSVALACLNTCARIMLPMAQNGLLPPRLATIHRRFATPHVALVVTIVAMFAIGAGMYAIRVAPIDIFNYCGTLSSLSFIVIYFLIAIAAPRYLRRIGELRSIDVGLAVLTCCFLAATAVTLFYPAPPPPTTIFPYLFIIYLAAGLGLYYLTGRRPIAQPASAEVSSPLPEESLGESL
jgi:amino acid transporter